MLTRLTYTLIAVLIVAVGFATELWGAESDVPVYLFLGVILLYGGLTVASAAGLTSPALDVIVLTGTVADLSIEPRAADFILRDYPASGTIVGRVSFRLGEQAVFMRTVPTIATGDAVVAAGVRGQGFEILALSDGRGVTTLANPRVPFIRPTRELILGLVSLPLLIGFYICYRVQRLQNLTHSWIDAIAAARELVAQAGPPAASGRSPLAW